MPDDDTKPDQVDELQEASREVREQVAEDESAPAPAAAETDDLHRDASRLAEEG